jgi:catalase (peroxidase I)
LILNRYQRLQTNPNPKTVKQPKHKHIKSPRNTQQITYKSPQTKLKHNLKQQPNKKQNPKNKHFNSTETQKKLHNHTLKD